jgi:hypothetical protein
LSYGPNKHETYEEFVRRWMLEDSGAIDERSVPGCVQLMEAIFGPEDPIYPQEGEWV